MQELNKALAVRQRALPTLQNKEAALRMEVARAKKEAQKYDDRLHKLLLEYEYMNRLWTEFDYSLVSVEDVRLTVKKIAGVKTPILEEVTFSIQPISFFNRPAWLPEGIELIKKIATLMLERDFFLRKMALLDFARKKTTQKVNLYEKVQIPGYEDAIRKIKRYLEDVENLSKSAQKIVKKRQELKARAVS